MSPTATTFLFEAANFLVLAGALRWLFFKPVRQALVDHRNQFEADNQAAKQRLAEAEQIKQSIDAAHTGLQAELDGFRKTEMEAARNQAAKIIADARTAAQRELENSHRQAARMSDLQRDRLAEVSATTAAQVVGRLLEQIGGPELQTALIDSACHQLTSMPTSELGTIKVESTQPLSPDLQSRIRTALGAATVSTDFRLVEGLGDGIRISTNKGLIDATVKGLVQFANQSLAKEMSRLANHRNPAQDASNE